MCFVLYVASPRVVPVVPWNDAQRALWTSGLTEHDHAMQQQFQLPKVTYVGSDQQCGCGFRHAMYQQGEWPEESAADAPDYKSDSTQPNHIALANFLGTHCVGEPFVELYGMWSGDYAKTPKGHMECTIDRLEDPKFFFRERMHYRVTGLPSPAASRRGSTKC